MRNRLLLFTLIGLLVGCASTKVQLDKEYRFISPSGKKLNISLFELDKLAREHIANYWDIPLEKLDDWNLRSAEYNEYHGGFLLRYDQNRIAPTAGVLFDRHGKPKDLMFFK